MMKTKKPIRKDRKRLDARLYLKEEFPCGMIHLYQKNDPKKGKG